MAMSKLKLIRMQRGMRQFDVALRVGISEQYLSRIECGRSKASDALLEKIATVLEVDPTQLTGKVKTAKHCTTVRK